MIQIEDVRQSFRVGFLMREIEILKGISFSVEKNAIYGLLGPNGAGKTTLIHLITGLRRPSGGEVRIAGHPADSPYARQKLGYLPERPYFHDHLTGRALLAYMGVLSGMSHEEVERRSPVVLEQVRMSHAADVELKRYSKGMLQRIGLAQAILHDPDLLVLDEPMSGLDPLGRKEIRELILHLADEGKTIFFSSHVIPDVEAICQRVAVLEKGKLTSCGSIGEFLAGEETQAEVAFSGVEPSQIKISDVQIAHVKKVGEGHRFTLNSSGDINVVVKQVIENGGSILWANPIRRSLESLFEKHGEAKK